MDSYHLYQVQDGWTLNCLCAHWLEPTRLMFHYSHSQGCNLEKEQEGKGSEIDQRLRSSDTVVGVLIMDVTVVETLSYHYNSRYKCNL